MAKTWQLDIEEVITEAYERAGMPATTLSDYQYSQAIRSLNILQSEWSARKPLLWTVIEHTIPLSQGKQTYTSADIGIEGLIDIVSLAIRYPNSMTDVQLESTAYDQWTQLPNKDQQGIPSKYLFERSIEPKLHVWYIPPADGYQLYGWFQTRPDDATDDYFSNPDIAYRFTEAMCAGLAYKLAVKVNPDRIQYLKPLYDEALEYSMQADDQNTGVDIAIGGI